MMAKAMFAPEAARFFSIGPSSSPGARSSRDPRQEPEEQISPRRDV